MTLNPADVTPYSGWALFVALVSLVLTAFFRGELVVRSLYDEQRRRAEAAETQAQRNTDAVVRLTAVIERQTAVIEERDRATEKILDGLAVEVAGLRPPGAGRRRGP